jgi:tetratricopeptide (TPR) repeat protein
MVPFECSAWPQTFGDYELLEEIARGGMGIVYKARQKSLDRIVALKMLLAGSFASDELVRRFKSEGIAAGRLQHPNIVAIHEVGIFDGQHFLVMDFVDGPNLAALVRDQPLPDKRAAAYVKKIAEAIHAAHERDVLHRDLKPSNVLVDAADQPRVTDFGLARHLDGASSLTLSGQVLGSPSYMPPEQAAALRDKVSRRSDVYGLGAILYHLLTGRPPFQGATIGETVHQVLNNVPIAPRVVNSDVARDLETICLKCLEKEPEQRYETAAELAEELERFLRDEPIEAVPVRGLERLSRWCRRKPMVASLAAAVVLTALMGVTGWLVARDKAGLATRATAAKAKADEDVARKTQQTEEILLANDELLLRQAFKDTNNLHGPALLNALDEAINRHPADLVLWQAKTEVLKRSNRFEDALKNLSRAVDLAGTMTNVPSRMLVEMLLARSRLLREMGRTSEADANYSEAGRINCQRKRIPERDPQTNPEMVDLSPFFQSSLPSFLDMLSTDGREAMNTFREDVKRNTGVEFDLRGGLDVWGRGKNSPQPYQYSTRPPESLTGIAINRRFFWLNALHSVWGGVAQDTKVAVYILHYADGQTREIPIIYGKHVRDVWRRDSRPPAEALLAWQGKSSGASKDSRGVQFFKTAWENPRPQAEVRSIDLSTRSGELLPILLGITVEEAKLGTIEFWNTRTKEAEESRNPEALLNILTEATKQSPEFPQLWISLGKILQQFGRTNEAVEAYTAAIDIAAPHANAKQKQLALALRSTLLSNMNHSSESWSGDPATPIVDLFNGGDLDGWDGDPSVWDVRNEMIHGSKNKAGVLVWRGGEVNDFELHFRFRLVRGNSSVYYRARLLPDYSVGGYEFEIYTNRVGELSNNGTDRIRRNLFRQDTLQGIDAEWHEGVIIAVGAHLIHQIDGEIFCDVQDNGSATPRKGHIAFSNLEGTTVDFKDIRLKRLRRTP